MVNPTKGKTRGFRLRLWNYVMIAAALLAALLLLLSAIRATGQYRALQQDTERYISAQQAANDMQQGSDYLMRQVRLFTVSPGLESVRLYFEEANVTQRRENAIALIQEQSEEPAALACLETALSESIELMQREYHAMRLMFDVYGEESALPDFPEVAAWPLTEEEHKLSAEEKKQQAQELVFGPAYRESKAKIDENVRQCTALLEATTRENQRNSAAEMERLLRHQQLLIAAMMLIVLSIAVVTAVMLIYPLLRAVEHVKAADRMPVTGAYEMRFLAESYNEMFEDTKRHREELSYEATHDALTGLLNRKAYEQAMADLGQQNAALIIVDVDAFKQINDTHGHAIGDAVLKTVARVLSESFRSDDCVCRIGGDEFVVLMRNATSDLRDMVANKIAQVRERLSRSLDGLPDVTLSIGAAFQDRKDPKGTLFQDADEALYRVKGKGRNGFEIY